MWSIRRKKRPSPVRGRIRVRVRVGVRVGVRVRVRLRVLGLVTMTFCDLCALPLWKQ